MGAPRIDRDPSFTDDLDQLRARYPFIEDVIEDFEALLRADYDLPERPIDRTLLPNTYAMNLDYPPLEEDGLQLFQVHYVRGPDNPWPQIPSRVFTLVTLIERRR
jgi:hypothetical protein